jgi:hypothetical protein
MSAFILSTSCRWGGCSNSTAHLVRHPILGFVEACGSCVEGWELGGDVIADLTPEADGKRFTVDVLDVDRFEQALAVKGVEL